MAELLSELRRRSVLRIAALYLVFGWLILQVADVAFGVLRMPDWALSLVAVILALGFVPACVFAWIYEVTPEGIQRDAEVDHDPATAAASGRRVNVAILLVLVAAVGIFAARSFMSGAAPPSQQVGEAVSTSPPPSTALPPDEDQPGSTAEAPERSGIAVLPFDSLSPDENDRYFAVGVYEDILTHLARVEGLRVISRTSMERIAETDLDVRAIGERLGVSHVLEGSVRRAGTQVRVTVQLIDALTDEQLWAGIYDRELENVFAIQSEIAQEVATSLRGSLSPETVARIEQRPTGDVVAYDYFLQARALVRRTTTADGFSRAALLLEQALGLDPAFLEAKALLAYASGRLVWNQRDPNGTHRQRAEELIADMQSVQPDDPLTWMALGDFRYTVERHYVAALDAYERALAGLPENLELAAQLVSTYKRLGRFDEAIAQALDILLMGESEAAWERLAPLIEHGGDGYGPWALKYDGYLQALFGDLPAVQDYVARLEASAR